MKLTLTAITALRWFSERGPVAWFGEGDPSRSIRRRLESAGLIQRAAQVRRGFFEPILYELSPAGRQALLIEIEAKRRVLPSRRRASRETAPAPPAPAAQIDPKAAK